MIDLGRLKRVLALVVMVTGSLLGLLGLRQAADAVLRAATGADAAAVFNEPPAPPAALLDVMTWLPDRERKGRVMEPATRRDITDAYARALAAIDRAGRGDTAAPLSDYLTGSALDSALDVMGDSRRLELATTHLRQELELAYYSDDGAIVAVSVPTVEITRSVTIEPGADRVERTAEAWRLVMVLEDGNWRLHQLQIDVRTAVEPSAAGAGAA